jgi:hypothetical protein
MMVSYQDNSDTLLVSNITYNDSGNFLFKFIPMFEVSYCSSEEKCDTGIINDVRDGVRMYRNPVCWNICTEKKKEKINTENIFKFIFGICMIMFLFFLFRD